MRRHVVPKLSDVDGLWKREVCQPLEGHALCLGKLFRLRPLMSPGEAEQASRDGMDHVTSMMTPTDRT